LVSLWISQLTKFLESSIKHVSSILQLWILSAVMQYNKGDENGGESAGNLSPSAVYEFKLIYFSLTLIYLCDSSYHY
jgi:hypothetical protein